MLNPKKNPFLELFVMKEKKLKNIFNPCVAPEWIVLTICSLYHLISKPDICQNFYPFVYLLCLVIKLYTHYTTGKEKKEGKLCLIGVKESNKIFNLFLNIFL